MEEKDILNKIKKEPKERVGFYLPVTLVDKLRILSDELNVASSAIVQLFVEDRLKKIDLESIKKKEKTKK